MDLETYEYLTGISVSNPVQVEAQIRRTQRMLEGMLGYTLDPDLVNKNLYNETGKALTECTCPDIDAELDEPDDVIGAYRLFPYDAQAAFFLVDPFIEVHAVKLVWNGITLKTFDQNDYRLHFINEWGKWIENCQCSLCFCQCENECVQLAVDADWLFTCDSSLGDATIGNCILQDLLYVWADMITYYANCKKDVKSESIGSHSYTKAEVKPPEELPSNLKILKKYAGPNGTLYVSLPR